MGLPLSTRAIVLPVGISFFTFMAISYLVDVYRGDFEPVSLAALRGLPLVLPAPRGRPDRAAGRAAPADGDAARPAPRRHEPRLLPDRDGPLQEGRDRELPRDAHHRPGVRGASQPLVGRDPRRGLRLRRPDLRRLRRVHRHGDRARAAARLPVPAELRLALRRGLAPGLLAPVAHDPVPLATGLPLHPARRKPEGPGPDVRQPADHDAARRALARSVVDVRRVGRHPRDRPRLRALAARQARVRRAEAEPRGDLGAAADHLQHRLLRLDLLPLGLDAPGMGDDHRPRHALGPAVAARHGRRASSGSSSGSEASTCRSCCHSS